MYSLLTKLDRADFLNRQLPSLIISIIVAELFYKFHSFVLECLAFLVTWFVIEAVIGLVVTDRREAADRERV